MEASTFKPGREAAEFNVLLESCKVGLEASDEGEELLSLFLSLAITAVEGKTPRRNPVCVT